MGKKKNNMLDRPMTIQEAYEARPRLWWLYTLVLLIVAVLLALFVVVFIIENTSQYLRRKLS